MKFHRRDNLSQSQTSAGNGCYIPQTYSCPTESSQLRLCISCFDCLVNDSVKLELSLMPERLCRSKNDIANRQWRCDGYGCQYHGEEVGTHAQNHPDKVELQGLVGLEGRDDKREMYTGRAGLHLWKCLSGDV